MSASDKFSIAPKPPMIDFALAYARRGWNVVPVRFKGKSPIGEGWQRRVIREADVPKYFDGAPQNVGVVLGASSGGLTDIDLDCREAVAIAPYVLPSTGALFGRASSRNSHWLYISDLHEGTHGATIPFRDHRLKGDEAMLLELRIGGRNPADRSLPIRVELKAGKKQTPAGDPGRRGRAGGWREANGLRGR